MEDNDNLKDACNLLYDELEWSPSGVPLGKRIKHNCQASCTMVNADRLYVCVATGNVHICTDSMCDQFINTQESKVCVLTGNTYEHEDAVGIYMYDNADRRSEELVADDRVVEAQMQHDASVQLQLVSEKVNSDNVVIRKRRRGVIATSVLQDTVAAAASSTDWATTDRPIVAKKAKPSVVELSDEKKSEVYSLTVAFLSHLQVDTSVIDVHSIAQASSRTWSHISSTTLFLSSTNVYQPRVHVAVMLRCIQKEGLVYEDTTFSPHIDALSLYIKCPKVFAPHPFGVTSKQFTRCSTLLRRCLAERATM